jgi:phosphoribosylanthranilate isomerase
VDYLGFNFYPGSPRYLSTEKAHEIIRTLPSQVQSVGIIVRPKLNDVLNIIKMSNITMTQIIEPQDFTNFSLIPVPVIAVQRINDMVSQTFQLNGAAMLLLDTYVPDELGGSGKKFDWSLIPDSIPREKLVLAGGITPENVAEAVTTVKPAVIDVASGAEISPGKKDITKVKRLIEVIYHT